MFFKKSPQVKADIITLTKRYSSEGILFEVAGMEPSYWLSRYEVFADADKMLALFLSRLEEEGIASAAIESLLIPWENLYLLLSDDTEQASCNMLGLPPTSPHIPVLSSQGAFSDGSFKIAIAWKSAQNNAVMSRNGGIIYENNTAYFLPVSAWHLAEAVRHFARLTDTERTHHRNEREWSRIRKLAMKSHAICDDFLERTIIVTPEKLHLNMRKVAIQGEQIVELMPTIEGVDPKLWLDSFDGYKTVQPHYDIVSENGGRISIIIDEAVAETLSEIKAMPGRRVAGERAKAFLRNPFAVMSEAAREVISEESFTHNLQEAGVEFYTFCHKVLQTENSTQIHAVELTIYSETENAAATDNITRFCAPQELHTFIAKLQVNIGKGLLCTVWEGYELELNGAAHAQLIQLQDVLARWQNQSSIITYQDVFDFTRYIARVEGIDTWKPTYSVFTAKKDNQVGWIPENIIAGIIKNENNDNASSDGVKEKGTDYEHEELPQSIPNDRPFFECSIDKVPEDEREALSALLDKVKTSPTGLPPQLDPEKWQTVKHPKPARLSLTIKQNIEIIDYEEGRNSSLDMLTALPLELPLTLLPSVALQKHQEEGVQWLQHLWRKTTPPNHVRGCIFADDMGLGKTLQLLTFIAWYIEKNPIRQPVLIIAPVSLLNNWQEEMRRFFIPNFAKVTMLYGDNLRKLRVNKNQVDSALREKGLSNFLKPGWLGDADIVLTTYETMRDLEFSLSTTKWSMMICDEAQKIKTPGALVTKAAKAQNARFKIACTGTPVENSLTDLWCLFDFIQPGYLGALNQFSRKYKRPIDTKEDDAEGQNALNELRTLIDAQIKRRMKKDVATLPQKYDDNENLLLFPLPLASLSLSAYQHNLYANAVNTYHEKREKAKDDPLCMKEAGTAMLGMLHRLRTICAHPGEAGFRFDPLRALDSYCNDSSKMAWLLKQLEIIKNKEQPEKVIIFTEFKEIQLVLQHYIKQTFGLRASIVNGDVKVMDTARSESRHKIISQFQESPGFNVLILSPVAVGFGVNIQAANHVIHYTRCWNPAKEDQATDRAYRIGQKKDVYVYYPTVHSDQFITFEKKLDMLLREKRKLADDMLNGGIDIFSDLAHIQDINGNTVINDTILNSSDLSNIEGKTFERLCQILWQKQGFTAHLNTRTPQGGIDVYGYKGNDGFVMQCKTTATEQALGRHAVTDVVSGHYEFARKLPNINFRKIAITNQFFNNEACKLANESDVELIDKNHIIDLLSKFSIYINELQ